MADLFSDFLENPTSATYGAMRDALLQDPGFEFASIEMDELENLAEEEDFAGVLDQFSRMMPDWILSPSVHQYAADAAREQGDEQRAKQEEYMVKACLRGISETGDGTRERPYLVTHPSDEYDFLEALGKVVVEHGSDESGDRLLDVLHCDDGTTLHFDLGAAQPRNTAENV